MTFRITKPADYAPKVQVHEDYVAILAANYLEVQNNLREYSKVPRMASELKDVPHPFLPLR